MPKHAYLIIAHNNFEQLAFLVSLLDFKLHDIYILIDKKSNFTHKHEKTIKGSIQNSNLFLIKDKEVNWGGYSQIQAEITLFKQANSTSHYSYFHLLSGIDLPLTSNNKIYSFFEENPNKIFVSLASDEIKHRNKVENRVKYYRLFPELSVRTSNNILWQLFIRIYRRIEIKIQALLGINLVAKHNLNIGYGSNWVSLDKQTTELILENISHIHQIYRNSILSDELFIPTLINQHNLSHKIYYSKGLEDKPTDFQGNLRYINWWDGSPYTWTDSQRDKDLLITAKNMGHLFSRKFDLQKYPSLRNFIIELTNDK